MNPQTGLRLHVHMCDGAAASVGQAFGMLRELSVSKCMPMSAPVSLRTQPHLSMVKWV